jgi:signal peptidase I
VLTPTREAAPPPVQGARWTTARRVALALVTIAVVVALIRAFAFQSFVVPTDSMSPTVHAGDRVLVWRLGSVHRGDVVVFDGAGVFGPEDEPAHPGLASAGRSVASAAGVPVGVNDYVKRVVGLPGDRVTCCDAQGRLTVNGRPLQEPYVAPGDVPSTVKFDVLVPAGRIWVMGDHRSDSADSRAHLADPGGGTVPEDRVVGRVVGVFWPLPHFGGLGPSGRIVTAGGTT